ncbi:MAG: hypothetical protein GF416_08020 [Candidatus Altiarchaeales archaeon]|nr:hypothetical protein [Candidatus Altiarchaeales archaeon]MBD3417060.1 hypothetical protein [Candidatus Altiarchaeales archaeon]
MPEKTVKGGVIAAGPESAPKPGEKNVEPMPISTDIIRTQDPIPGSDELVESYTFKTGLGGGKTGGGILTVRKTGDDIECCVLSVEGGRMRERQPTKEEIRSGMSDLSDLQKRILDEEDTNHTSKRGHIMALARMHEYLTLRHDEMPSEHRGYNNNARATTMGEGVHYEGKSGNLELVLDGTQYQVRIQEGAPNNVSVTARHIENEQFSFRPVVGDERGRVRDSLQARREEAIAELAQEKDMEEASKLKVEDETIGLIVDMMDGKRGIGKSDMGEKRVKKIGVVYGVESRPHSPHS